MAFAGMSGIKTAILSDPHRPARSAAIVAGMLALAFGLGGCLSGGSQPPVPLAKVDMSRMYGGWYLIATRRNAFEKGMVTPYDVYSRRPDGDSEDFYVRDKSFQAPPEAFHHP